MIHLLGEYRMYKGQYRLYHTANTICTLTATLIISTHLLANHRYEHKTGNLAELRCIQFPRNVKIPIFGPLEVALADQEPNSAAFLLEDASATWKPGGGGTPSKLGKAISYAVNPIFVEFYEAGRKWLEDNINGDAYRWPAQWNFARVVRNAIVHNNGKVFWTIQAPRRDRCPGTISPTATQPTNAK